MTEQQTDYLLEDSGERQQFDTGAVRDPAKGKGRYDLITPHGLKRLALHYEADVYKRQALRG